MCRTFFYSKVSYRYDVARQLSVILGIIPYETPAHLRQGMAFIFLSYLQLSVLDYIGIFLLTSST